MIIISSMGGNWKVIKSWIKSSLSLTCVRKLQMHSPRGNSHQHNNQVNDYVWGVNPSKHIAYLVAVTTFCACLQADEESIFQQSCNFIETIAGFYGGYRNVNIFSFCLKQQSVVTVLDEVHLTVNTPLRQLLSMSECFKCTEHDKSGSNTQKQQL